MSEPVSGTYQQADDGSWQPAQPLGWQEEHGRLARFVFWLRGVEHCNDREGRRWRRCDVCGKRLSRGRRALRLTVCGGTCYSRKFGSSVSL